MIETIDNKYDGVLINNKTLPQEKSEFKKEMVRLIEFLKNKKLKLTEQQIKLKVPDGEVFF